MEHDITLLEGSGYEITLNVLTADSVPATAEEHEVYGALEQCGARTPFAVSPTGEAGQWLVTIPAVIIGAAMALPYQIFVRRLATGHEWLVLSGTVRLRHRYAAAGDALATPPLTATATLSADSASLTVTELHGVRGEKGDSTYDIARRHGFEGTEAEWLASLKAEYATEAASVVSPLAAAAQSAATAALASADDADSAAMTASEHMADAEAAARTASASAQDAATSARAAADSASDAIAAAQNAGKEAGEAAAAEVAGALAELAQMSGDNNFTGNNTHAGAEVFNGETALNGGITYPGGSTTAAELAAGYFYARRYWELATDIAGLFESQNIDFLPKDENGLVKLKFTKATKGQYAFRYCKCYSGLNLEMPAITDSGNLRDILGNFSSGTNKPYNYATVKLVLPKITAVNLVAQLWAEKFIIDAPLSVSFSGSVRGMAVYGSMPKTETVSCVHEYYTKNPDGGHKWFVALPALKKGSFGAGTGGSNKWRMSAESVFCVIGTIPAWDDGGAHELHLNILPALQNNADFQARLALALGAQNEDGTYKGALVREYVAGGSSGADELGEFNDSYVADKGWQITISYN